MDVRKYVIACPTAPLEPEGTRVLPGNVLREVRYTNGVKLVTWDYSQAVY